MPDFRFAGAFQPTGDQPRAIEGIVEAWITETGEWWGRRRTWTRQEWWDVIRQAEEEEE